MVCRRCLYFVIQTNVYQLWTQSRWSKLNCDGFLFVGVSEEPAQFLARTCTYLLSTSFLAEHMLTQSSRIGAAVIGTGVGLYVVLNQDTNHGAEHHPLGEPHGEGDAPKHGTDSTVKKTDEKPEEEPKEEPKKESEEKSEEKPKSEHKDPSKPTKENSEEKDKQSPDESDKVGRPKTEKRLSMLTCVGRPS